MGDDLYQLKPSTVVEPLVDRWWAWSHLIAPATSCLHLSNYQIPTLESYLQDPESHVRASRDPELIGGPFVDIPVHRVDDVRVLLDCIRSRRSRQLALADELTDFVTRIAAITHGQSLEPFYSSVPETLKGCVELTYDYMHRGTVRVIEPLLSNRYYTPSLQHLRLFERTNRHRAFFMSTPRLREKGDLEWNVAFSDTRVNELFKTDINPAPLGRFREVLGISDRDAALLMTLLVPARKQNADEPTNGAIRVRHFGHACMLVEWNGTSILTDPFVESGAGVEFQSLQDLPPHIDFALVTHNHQDHFSLETLLRLRPRIETLVLPRSMGLLYGDISLKFLAHLIGFRNVVEMDVLESLPIRDGEIIAVPFLGEHADLGHGKSGYVVRAGKHQMWFAADSDCLDRRTYEYVRKSIGRIETLFIGCESVGAPLLWTCGPFFPRKPTPEQNHDRRYHGANARTALELAESIGARRIYNYAMGLEPWMRFVLGLEMTEEAPQWQESEKLLKTARRRGLIAERPYGRWRVELNARGNPSFQGWSPVFTPQNPRAGCVRLHIEMSIRDAAAKVVAEVGCSLPSLYLAAVCSAEARPTDECICVATVNGGNQAGAYEIDLAGDPSLPALAERVEAALTSSEHTHASSDAVFAFAFDCFEARGKAPTLAARAPAVSYWFNSEGSEAALHSGDAVEFHIAKDRLTRIVSILENGTANPTAPISALMPQGRATSLLGDSDFTF